jgi:hypothetical protein
MSDYLKRDTNKKPTPKKKQGFITGKYDMAVFGAITLSGGIALGLWANSHSPSNFSSALIYGWMLTAHYYYFFIVVSVLLAICGVVYLFRAMKKFQKDDAPKGDTTQSDNNDLTSQLERLGKLKEQGILNQEEFDTQKKILLEKMTKR